MATVTTALATAVAHHQAGRLELAAEIYRRILAVEPQQADALHLLGALALQRGEHALAAGKIRQAIAVNPQVAAYHNNLGNALLGLGKLDAAIRSYGRAVELDVRDALAQNNLGYALQSAGRLDEALAAYERALQLSPGFAAAHNNLGGVYRVQGKLQEAVACFQRAVQLQPDYAEAYNNLAVAWQALRKLDEARACCARAVELRPDYAEAQLNLGNVYKDQACIAEALACYGRAQQLRPGHHAAHSNRLYTLLYSPEHDAASILAECRQWDEVHAAPLAADRRPHTNQRAPERPLRIGYVSSNFRQHPLSLIAGPLLQAHDHGQFAVYGYSDVVAPDAETDRLQGYADVWRMIGGWPDVQVAEQIRADAIDILVDLTMHMADHRLLVFARKPAPVQVCWFAYPGTTGLAAIDYRFTDPHLDPPGLGDGDYSEVSVRLPDTFWCYDPGSDKPDVGPLPALANGYVTFGCLNNFCKINAGVLQVWAAVLRAMPDARLMLLSKEGTHRLATLDTLQAAGVAAERVSFVGMRARSEYLKLYQQIDLGLDTFPYNGHTTSLDSFWMGVPVVSLVGRTVVGRAGLSQLTNLGLPELAATTPEQFVALATQLAGDRKRLTQLRGELRGRMQASPLMDGPRFARGVENAYRRMWQRWCAEQAPPPNG
jgi:predicted O-linked N-acetylglucosamine transferase (SPINDLY family)